MENNIIINHIVPAVRMIFSDAKLASCAFISKQKLHNNSNNLEISENTSVDESIIAIKKWKASFSDNSVKTIHIENSGTIIIASSAIDVSNFKKGQVTSTPQYGRMKGRVAVITGGAQGFGGGIAEELFSEGANIVIADLNEDLGNKMADSLNSQNKANRAIFVKADVSKAQSVEELVTETASKFGGLDTFISNAGVLRAGGLDEMDEKTFNFMTNVNYTGYFNCAKYSSAIMKIQNKYAPNYSFDIIQINSKSGLKGSNKNFAYAGGKFGGIGLTQSFAMELMPNRIKVNSICPGNFFEGPLWSDPEKGLFVQYLNAGKVPGAKTLDEVKQFYEAQVPAGRGCRVIDVARAIYYAIEQEYETGQAIPVTGGQNMLH